MSCPPASRLMSPATSISRLPEDKEMSVPSIVILSILIPPLAVNVPDTLRSVDAHTTAAPEPAPSE